MAQQNEGRYVLGIDLGTTFSAVAVQEGCGNIRFVEMLDHSRSLPTIISVTDVNKFAVGAPDPGFAAKFPRRVVTDIKRMVGRRHDDPELRQDSNHWPFDIVAGLKGEALVSVSSSGVENYAPLNLLSEVAKALVQQAGLVIPGSARDPKDRISAVICVPARFDKVQRLAIRTAADMARIKVIEVVHEPTAAALACVQQLDHLSFPNGQSRVVAVFDWGGGTFDVSVIRVRENNMFRVLTTGGDPHLGGRDIDNALVEWAVDKFEQNRIEEGFSTKEELQVWETDRKARSMEKLRTACEYAKKKLSTESKYRIFVSDYWRDELKNDYDLDLELDRKTLNELAEPFLDKAIKETRKTFDVAYGKFDKGQNNGGIPESLNNIFLVGGTSYLKIVEERMRAEFPSFGVVATQDSELLVAKGAAIWGANLGSCEEIPMEIQDIIVQNIGIERECGGYSVVLHKDTLLPAEGFCYCTNDSPTENNVEFRIYEGNDATAQMNRRIGTAHMTLDCGAKDGTGHCTILFKLRANFDGTLVATAEDQKTGKLIQTELKISLDAENNAVPNNMSREQIQTKLDRDNALRRYRLDLGEIKDKLETMYNLHTISTQDYDEWFDTITRAFCHVSQQRECAEENADPANRIERNRLDIIARFARFHRSH